MTETLTLRLDTTTRRRLDALSRRSGRSKSVLAAEAVAAYLESEEWKAGEIEAAIADLDARHSVSHDRVAAWLASWGKK
ncbi:MAG: ribbon-helix-helix protein, CopG family [Bryobacteraceae bacterium]|nr:ribbon-helix-helix protein, CopG family [Bryobacteraceae bacterium]